jgi:hypothetical protein
VNFSKQAVLALVILLASSPFLVSATSFASSGVTCSVTIIHENGSHNAVQSAINQAEMGSIGPRICVDGGSYPEQLTINTSNIQLIGLGTISNPTVFNPSTVSSTFHDPDDGNPVVALVVVSGHGSVSGVVIKNVVIDGAPSSGTVSSTYACGVDYEGIFYLNASGTISRNTVKNIAETPAASYGGCQTGLAINVESHGASSNVLISNNTVTTYQKNGITCDDAGTYCDITFNRIAFNETYSPFIASNGIQIANAPSSVLPGAIGTVSYNTIANNTCTEVNACGPNGYLSSGILTYQSGHGTIVWYNTLISNDMGIALFNDSVGVQGNLVVNSTPGYGIGIYALDGHYAISKNTINHSHIGIQIVSDGLMYPPPTYAPIGTHTHSVVKIGHNTWNSDSIRIQLKTYKWTASSSYGKGSGTITLTFDSRRLFLSGNSTVNLG